MTNGKGYFSEEQVDRINLKTMANPIDPYSGHDLLALLVTLCDEGVGGDWELDPVEAKDKVTEWYCTNTSDVVVEMLDAFQDNEKYWAVKEFQKLIHAYPKQVAEAIDAVERGWRPGDPK